MMFVATAGLWINLQNIALIERIQDGRGVRVRLWRSFATLDGISDYYELDETSSRDLINVLDAATDLVREAPDL
jgi:hypothetical protein